MRKPVSHGRTVDCASRIARLCTLPNVNCKRSLNILDKSLPVEHSYHKVRDKSVLLLLLSNGSRNKDLPTLIEGVLRAEDCTDSFAENEYIESFLLAAIRQEADIASSSSATDSFSHGDIKSCSMTLSIIVEASGKMKFHTDCTSTLLVLAFLRVITKNDSVFKKWCSTGSSRSTVLVGALVNMILTAIRECILELNARNVGQSGSRLTADISTLMLCMKTIMRSLCYEALHLTLESALLNAIRDNNNSAISPLSEGSNQLGEIFDLCDGCISADGILIELLSALSSQTPLSNGICAIFCGVLSQFYTSAQNCLLSVCSISAALDYAVPVQTVRHRGSQCVKHLFDLWQHCHGYYISASVAGEVQATDGIPVGHFFKWSSVCAVVATADEGCGHASSGWSCTRQSMQVATRGIVNLLGALSSHEEINAARPDTQMQHTYCFELTRDVSDYVLSLYVQQCSSGELLYCDSENPSNVMLKSDVIAGLPVFGFNEQDAEIGHNFSNPAASSPSFVNALLQALCSLFTKELFISTQGRPTLGVRKPWAYEDTNCFYFICSVLNLSYPNGNQNEILVSLYNSLDVDSQSVINAAGTPVTVGSVRTDSQLQQGFNKNMVPYVYVISSTMLRLLGHIVVLLNSRIAGTVAARLAADPMDLAVASLINGNSKFKDQVFQGFQQLHQYIGGLITQHLDLDSAPRENDEYTSDDEDEVAGFGVALKPVPTTAQSSEAASAPASAPPSAAIMMNSYIWIIYCCINHQLCRMAVSELSCYYLSYCAFAKDSQSKAPAGIALRALETDMCFNKVVKFFSHSFVSMIDVAAKILSGFASSRIPGSTVSLFHCSSDHIVSDGVAGTTTRHHWRFCRECLSGLSEQHMYLLHYTTSLRHANVGHTARYTHFLADELVGLFSSKMSEYSSVFYFAHSGAMIEAGLGFLLLPISACLRAVSEKRHCGTDSDDGGKNIKYAYGDMFSFQYENDSTAVSAASASSASGPATAAVSGGITLSQFREFWYSLSMTLFAQSEVYDTRAATTYTLTGVLYSTTAPGWRHCVESIACYAPPLLFNYTPGGVDFAGCVPGSTCPYEILALVGSTTVSTTFETATPYVKKITSTLAYAEPLHSNCMLAKHWDIYRHGSPAAQQKAMTSTIVALLRTHVSSVIPQVHYVSQRIVKKFPIALVFYVSSVVHLESIRASSHLDFRVFFEYLGRSACVDGTLGDVAPGKLGMSKMERRLQTILMSVSEHIYDVWEAAILRQLGPGTNPGSAAASSGHSCNSIMFGTPVHETIRATFNFCLVRMISSSEVVRKVSSKYAGYMLKRFRWLHSDKTSIFTLLDTVRALMSELPSNAQPDTCGAAMYALPFYYNHRSTTKAGSVSVPAHITINPWAPNFSACVGRIDANIGLVLRILDSLLLFGYQWLSEGRSPEASSPTAATASEGTDTYCTHTPKDTTVQTILQEYMFSNDFVLSAEQSTSFFSVPTHSDSTPCHTLSYEMAKEMCYSALPCYHEVGMVTVNSYFPPTGHIKKSKWAAILNKYDLSMNKKGYPKEFLFFITRCRSSAVVASKIKAAAGMGAMSLGAAETEPHIANAIVNNELLMKADAFAAWSKIRGSTAWVASPLAEKQTPVAVRDASNNYYAKLLEEGALLVRTFRRQLPPMPPEVAPRADAPVLLSPSEVISSLWKCCAVINGCLYHTSFSSFNNDSKHKSELRRLLQDLLDVAFISSFARCYSNDFVVANIVSCWKWLFSLCTSSGRVKGVNVVENPLLTRLDVVHVVVAALQKSQDASRGMFYNSHHRRWAPATVDPVDIRVDVDGGGGDGAGSKNENIQLVAPSNRWNVSRTLIDCGLMNNADTDSGQSEGCIWETKPQQDALTLLQSWLNIYPDCYSFVLQPVARLVNNLARSSIYCAKSASSATSNYVDIDHNCAPNNKEFLRATNAARLQLLSFSLELIHLSMSRPYSVVDFVEGGMKIHFSPTSRRVLRENILLLATHSFNYGINGLATSNVRGKRVETQQVGESFEPYVDGSKRMGVAAIFAMHNFLARLQVDMKYWNMEYAKRGDANAEVAVQWDTAASFMSDSLLAIDTSRGLGGGGFRARKSTHGGDSLIHHLAHQKEKQQRASEVFHRHRRHGIALNMATTTSSGFCGMNGPAKPLVAEQCGVYQLLHSFIVDEVCRLIAWVCPTGIDFHIWDAHNPALNDLMESFLHSYVVAHYAMKQDTQLYKRSVRAAWVQSPSLAVALQGRFHRSSGVDGARVKMVSVISHLFRVNPLALRHFPEMAVRLQANLFRCRLDTPVAILDHERKHVNALNSFVYWGFGSADLCVELLSRVHSYGSEMQLVLRQTDAGNTGVYCCTDNPNPRVLIMEPGASTDVNATSPLHTIPVVVLYCVRSLKALPLSAILFYLPQLVQLLRRDVYGLIAKLIAELSALSASICHQVVWLLQTESVDESTVSHGKKKPAEIQAAINSGDGVTPQRASITSESPTSPSPGSSSSKAQHVAAVANARHGRCRELPGSDPMPKMSKAVITTIRKALSAASLQYLDAECEFFNQITNISALLTLEKDKSKHNLIIHNALVDLGPLPDGVYMPTAPMQRVVSIDTRSGIPMQSAAKCPYLLNFHTEAWDGPDSFGNETKKTAKLSSSMFSVRVPKTNTPMTAEGSAGGSLVRTPGTPSDALVKARSNRGLGTRDPSAFGTPKVVRGGSSAPPFTPMRGGHEEEDEDGSSPPRGQTTMSVLSTDACIFKVYDDCRQDALTLQLFQILKAVYISLGLPLTLICYGIIPNRSGANFAVGGILEVIKNVNSRHQLGSKLGARTLSQYFVEKFGMRTLKPFKAAQMRFAESLAGYSVVTYLLWVKDRYVCGTSFFMFCFHCTVCLLCVCV